MAATQQAPKTGRKAKFFIAADNRETYLRVAKALGPDKEVFWTDNRIAPLPLPRRANDGTTAGREGPEAVNNVAASNAGGGAVSGVFESAYTDVRNRLWSLWPKRSKNPGTDLSAIVDLFLLARSVPIAQFRFDILIYVPRYILQSDGLCS